MSRRGNCYENAAMELLWSTLKTETGLDDSVPDQSSCRRIDRLRLHRDLLQPGETPQLARLPLTCGLRKPTNEKRQPSRLIPLSIFSRQAQLEPGGAREARGAARLDVLPLGAEGGEGPPARTGAGIASSASRHGAVQFAQVQWPAPRFTSSPSAALDATSVELQLPDGMVVRGADVQNSPRWCGRCGAEAMLAFPPAVRIFVAVEPVDMRKQFS